MIRSLARWPAVLSALLPAAALAQDPAPAFQCAGQTVSRVTIEPAPPPFSGAAKRWRAMARAVGLHHATTTTDVVQAFLSLEAGRPCTEFRRAESERILRAQPFLSDAQVLVSPDTGGTVSVLVTTVDEIPVLVSGRMRGLKVESFGIGNENIGGAGLRAEAHIERGHAYRTAFGGRIQQDALFGRPYRLTLQADRFQQGYLTSAEMEHPFFTDLQRISWHTGVSASDTYMRVERPARDPLGLRVRDRAWDLSGVLRVFGTTTVTLFGGAVTGRRFDPARTGMVISDSGLRPDTGFTLRDKYQQFHVGRVGVTAGIRRVHFESVTGFDALTGSQDVANGAMIGVFAAKSLDVFGDEDDMLFSTAAYAGASSGNAFLASVVQAEVRNDRTVGDWDSLIGSSRTAFYWGRAPGVVMAVSNELSLGWRSRLPLQFTFRDRNGGLIGYRNSALAGAHRSVTNAELRWSAASLVRRADVGFATFAEMGNLWAGDAPYGVTATRVAAGVSLLAAYPTRAKRMYRVDVAFPFTRGEPGGGKLEVRFSSADRTQSFWREPHDVTRSRTGTEPNRLFAWPSQ